MAYKGNITYQGASGKDYIFKVYEKSTTFNDVGAVYLITKSQYKKAKDRWYHSLIYIGQTQDLSARFDNHHKENCFKEKQYNRICVYRVNGEKTRLKVEKDLLDNYDPPCNG